MPPMFRITLIFLDSLELKTRDFIFLSFSPLQNRQETCAGTVLLTELQFSRPGMKHGHNLVFGRVPVFSKNVQKIHRNVLLKRLKKTCIQKDFHLN